MKLHWLTIVESGLIQERFLLKGNYIVGRIWEKCKEFALAFDEAPTLLIFEKNRHLSGLHCVLFQDAVGYQLIDGWGQYFSTNGISLNGCRVEFATLNHGDVILLGSEISLIYECERDISESQKQTLS